MKTVVENNLNHNMGDDIVFVKGELELLRLNSSGDIFVKGKLVAHDLEVTHAMSVILCLRDE